jgi:hypothetical protein
MAKLYIRNSTDTGWHEFWTIDSMILDALADVDLTALADGEMLAWDADNNKWINIPSPTAGAGDMTKAIYDQDDDGVVDSAEDAATLAGNLPSHFATAGDFDLHAGATNNPHTVTKAQVDLGEVPNLKVKLDATVDPTATDDNTQGYAIGSRWVNVTDDKEFVCLDATTNTAVWTETTGGGTPGGSPLTVEETDGVPSVANVVKIKVSGGTLTDNGSGVVTIQTGGGTGGGSLGDLSDVSLLTTPVEGEVLTYDGALDRWTNIPLDQTPPVYGENLSSQISTTAPNYYVANEFVPYSLKVYWNGIRQEPAHITEHGNHLGFTAGFTAVAGDVVFVDYERSLAGIGIQGTVIAIREEDYNPALEAVSTIVVGNGDLINLGGGQARLKTASDAVFGVSDQDVLKMQIFS